MKILQSLLFVALFLPFALSESLVSNSLSNILSKFGHSKHTYQNGDEVDLLVNKAISQVSNVPYSYYKLPFVCPPSSSVKPVHMSLSEILSGDNLMQSDYLLKFGQDEPCLRLCDRIMHSRNIKKSYNLVKNNFIAHWLIDSLPASTTFISETLEEKKKYYIPGFPLGFMDGEDAFLHNHLMMVIRYHREDNDRFSIVGFEVYPKSVDDYICPGASKNFQNVKLDLNAENQLIHFTYSIYWREDSEINYNDRWKLYIDPSLIDSEGNLLRSSKQKNTIHWVSLINSLVVLSFVSLIVGFIILSTFSTSSSSSSTSSTNFNLIAQNSFIRPKYLEFLCIITGSGIQLIFTLLVSALLSLLFFRHTFGKEATLLSATLSILIIGGFFAGFSSIQMFKLFNNLQLTYKRTVLISSLSGSFLISICLIAITISNYLIFEKDSPRSMKFSTFISLFTIYTLFQIPISVIGGLLSRNFNLFKNLLNKKISSNINSKNEPYSRKSQYPLYLRFPFSLLIIGIFPCSIVFIESRFVYMKFLSESTSAYILGFLIVSAILLSIAMTEIGIVATFLRLNKSNSQINWQWWTFLNCSSSIWIYLVSTSIYQLTYKLNLVDSGSPILYIVYTTILNTIVSIACGSLALWSATFFIYAVVISNAMKKE